MVTFNAVLIATAFGLYYTAVDWLRPWVSNIHIGVGLCLPALFLAHVVAGRRGATSKPKATPSERRLPLPAKPAGASRD